jgi:hypothetical protein
MTISTIKNRHPHDMLALNAPYQRGFRLRSTRALKSLQIAGQMDYHLYIVITIHFGFHDPQHSFSFAAWISLLKQSIHVTCSCGTPSACSPTALHARTRTVEPVFGVTALSRVRAVSSISIEHSG